MALWSAVFTACLWFRSNLQQDFCINGGGGVKLTELGTNIHVHRRNQMSLSWLLGNSKGFVAAPCLAYLSGPLIHPAFPTAYFCHLDLLLFSMFKFIKANTLLSWPACCGRLWNHVTVSLSLSLPVSSLRPWPRVSVAYHKASGETHTQRGQQDWRHTNHQFL